jgi:hypothetical protein
LDEESLALLDPEEREAVLMEQQQARERMETVSWVEVGMLYGAVGGGAWGGGKREVLRAPVVINGGLYTCNEFRGRGGGLGVEVQLIGRCWGLMWWDIVSWPAVLWRVLLAMELS